MQLFIQTLLVITCVAGTFCQKITFDNTDAGGVAVGRFYIDGTIGGNVTELVRQKWQPIIFIEVMRINASRFFPMCQFDVSGAICAPYPDDICQCVYNTATDNVHFVVNGTASPDLYKAIIRAQWQHQNASNVYSNMNYTVPGPKDEPSTVVEPTIDGSTATAGTFFKFASNYLYPRMLATQYSEHTNHAYEERRTSPSNVTIDEVKATPDNNLQQYNSHQKHANNSHLKDRTNGGSASQTVPGEPRQLPPLKGTNIHGQLQPAGQPHPPSLQIASQTVKYNN